MMRARSAAWRSERERDGDRVGVACRPVPSGPEKMRPWTGTVPAPPVAAVTLRPALPEPKTWVRAVSLKIS